MVWRPDQLGQFLDHAHDDRLYALWHLYAFRGLRRGEAAGLEWPEVDLEGGTIAIVRQRLNIGGKAQEDTPKSDAGERIIALDAETVAVFRAHRQRQREERMAAGSAWVESGKVFCMEDGSALNPERITDWFHELTAEAGLPPIRLHDLRHGAASLMLAAGVSMKTVQETLGHSSLVLTANTYTSVYPEVATAAAEAAVRIVPRVRRTSDGA
jgi:integrase